MTNKNFILIALLSFLAACNFKPSPYLHIRSSTPARIEKNGTIACMSTPCTVVANYQMGPYGECINGANTRLEAFPLDSKTGFKQSKVAFASCGWNENVFFDMNSGVMINTVMHNPDSTKLSNESITGKLEFLQNLKKKGLITNEDYKTKKMEILSNIK